MKMKYSIKLLSLLLILSTLTVSVCGCGYLGYRGDHKGAYTLAYTQIPGTRGARNIGPGFDDASVIPLENDSYGRGLYIYFESTEGPLSILITQKESDEAVYFYPEKSALSFKTPTSLYDLYEKKVSDDRLLSLYKELCSEEVLAGFKEQNDWNKPINEEKLDSAKITLPKIATAWEYRKGDTTLSDEEWKENMFSVALENGHNIPEDYLSGYHGMNIYDNWMATDSYGRQLYYVESQYCVYSEEDVFPSTTTWYYLEMLAIINPDGSYDPECFMIEILDKINYQEQLSDLKSLCGWNQPLGEEESK